MYVKRNFKMNPKVRKNAKKIEPMVNETPHKLKSNGYGKYKFPTCDYISAGYYISRIMRVKDVITNKGKPALEVYYKLEDVAQCYKRARNKLSPNQKIIYYYIKQQYPKDKSCYEEFLDAMSYALYGVEGNEVEIEKIVGIEEYIGFSYKDYSPIGGIDERDLINYDYFFGEDEEENSDNQTNNNEDEETLDEQSTYNDFEEDFEFDEDWLE